MASNGAAAGHHRRRTSGRLQVRAQRLLIQRELCGCVGHENQHPPHGGPPLDPAALPAYSARRGVGQVGNPRSAPLRAGVDEASERQEAPTGRGPAGGWWGHLPCERFVYHLFRRRRRNHQAMQEPTRDRHHQMRQRQDVEVEPLRQHPRRAVAFGPEKHEERRDMRRDNDQPR